MPIGTPTSVVMLGLLHLIGMRGPGTRVTDVKNPFFPGWVASPPVSPTFFDVDINVDVA